MKITDVKVVPVNKFLFVKVFTDEGITGLGESPVSKINSLVS